MLVCQNSWVCMQVYWLFKTAGVSRKVRWSTTLLNSVSSQWARGKSSLARKPEVHPKFFNGKKLFKNVTLQT